MNALVKVAAFLGRIRFIIWTIAAAAAAWFVYELLGSRPAEFGALPALTLFLWAVLLLGISYSFPAGPPAIADGDGFWLRLRKRASRAMFWTLGLVTLGVAGFVLFLTGRTLSLALG